MSEATLGYKAYLSFLVVNHDIVWLDIPVHDAFAMAEVQRLEKFEDVEPHIVVHKARIERSEVRVVHVLEDQAGSLALTVSHNVQQCDNIWPARQILKNLDLSFYFLLLDRFQDFDDAFLVVDDVDALEYFGVFASA